MTPGEYEGPLVITRPCVVDGGMSTLWASNGPTLLIDAPSVTIKNLRIEVAGGMGQTGIAVQTNYPDTVLSGVEVSGDVVGFPGEEPVWTLPTVIPLGRFAADQVNSFSYHLNIPMDAQLSCSLKDIAITPVSLTRGMNQLFIETGRIRADTILYGEIIIKSMVSRRIYISGKAGADAPRYQTVPPPPRTPPRHDIPQDIVPGAPLATVVKGQRLSAKGLQSQPLRIAYACKGSKRPIDVDGYVFLLQDNGKVSGDSDLIFFGNPASSQGSVSVSISQGQPTAIVHLGQIEARVSKIVVCFSIYGDNPAERFSLADEPCIRVLAGEQYLCRFPLTGLGQEKTIVAMELYRYKGEWKMHFIGAGYHSGMGPLCARYGVEVE